MASTISAIACPHCGCCATLDDQYKLDNKIIWCFRCGYYYEKVTKYIGDTDEFCIEENEYEGYGRYALVTKDGETKDYILFHQKLSDEDIQSYLNKMQKSDVDLEQSYLVLFVDGEFQFLAGTIKEDFYLPFEEYKVKCEEKGENVEIIIPV